MLDSFASAGGGLFDAAFSAWSMNEEQKYNTAEAQTNRNFQKMMSDTSYQRAVEDLNKAGLSPMLAYSKGGATTPGGATASSTTGAKSDMSGAIKRDVESDLLREQMEVAKSQRELNVQTASKVAEEAKLAAQRVLQEPARFYLEQAEAGSRVNANSATTIKTDVDAANNAALRTPSSDPYWYRDIKKGGKAIFDKFLEKNKSFPWSLEGKR